MENATAPLAAPTQGHAPIRGAVSTAELAALTAGLLVLLVTAKALLLPFPVETATEFCRWLLRLAIVASADVCFAIFWGGVAYAVNWLAGPWKATGWVARPTIFLLFYAAGLYGVAAVPIFRYTMVPLTLPALHYAGGPDAMASSITACLSWQAAVALALVPLALLSLGWLARRLQARLPARRAQSALPRLRPRLGFAAICGLLLGVTAYGLVCRQYIAANWTDPNRWERRISASPHAVFLWSCAEQWVLGENHRFNALLAEADNRDWTAPRLDSGIRYTLPPDFHPRNVLVVVLESTGTDSMSLYGSPHRTTPELERLVAEQGLVFDNFYVQTPNSCKSLVSLTASVVPRLDWGLIVRDYPGFSIPTVAQVLAERGYRSCFAHSGYWGWKNRDRYLGDRGGPHLIDAASLQQPPYNAPQLNSWGVPDRPMFQATLDWIDQNRQQPFFALTYTIETHHPYVAPEPLTDFGVNDEKHNRYLNALRETDRQIAWLVAELKRRDLANDTLVVITSDHGESFGQHNQTVHSFSVYESAVHVPLILLHPSFANLPDRYLPQVRQQIDLPYTLVSLLGVKPPETWQGQHLLDAADRRAYFFSTGNNVACGLRDGDYKYHFYVDSGHEELFHLPSDPEETTNLAPQQPDRCQSYRRRWGGLIEHQPQFLRQYGG